MVKPPDHSTVRQINPDDLADDEWDRIMADSAVSGTPLPAIGYHVTDSDGEIWEVWGARTTHHDFAIYLGRPRSMSGPGGAAVILTAELVDYLGQFQRAPDLIDLPISRTTIGRLRRALGHNWYEDGEQWWLRRMNDLETLTTTDFAVRHNVKAAAVTYARLNILGSRLRTAEWWRDPTMADMILSNQPRQYLSVMLDISPGYLGSLRSRLRKDRGESMAPESVKQRISDAKMGRLAHPNTKAALLHAAQQPKSEEWRAQLSERNRQRPRPASWTEQEYTEAEDAILGTAPDRAVAQQLGRPINGVRARRRRLNIKAFAESPKK